MADEGVPADSPIGHARNGLAALQAYREAYGYEEVPTGVRQLLYSVERRMRLAIRGLELVEADWRGGLHLVTGCSCIADAAGTVVLPCVCHDDRDDDVRRND